MPSKALAFLLALVLTVPASGAMSLSGAAHILCDSTIVGDPTTSITVSCWVNPTTNLSNIFVQKFSNSANQGWVMYQPSSAGQLRWAVVVDGAFRSTTLSSLVLNNVWSHLAGTFDGSTLRLYVNGVELGSASFSGSITRATTQGLNIGGTFNDTANFHMDGQVDDVRIYNRALTAAEISSLAESRSRLHLTDGLILHARIDEGVPDTTAAGNGAVRDRSGNGNHGTPTTVSSSPTWRASSWINYP